MHPREYPKKKCCLCMCGYICLLFIPLVFLGCDPEPPCDCTQSPLPLVEESYGMVVEDGYLTMSDGVQLAVTYYKPAPRTDGERFPIVLEMLPYRKDDDFYQRDYELEWYFPKRGIAIARVDVRGSGGSEGTRTDREYSTRELDDAQEVIELLAGLPWSNGNIGMQGISWGGFNAIMSAMRRPPHLKAILAAHASDDLYGNDIHYIDGGLHLDVFSIEIEVENIVPRSPDYPVDDTYFTDRFEPEPWVFTYLRHQRDGAFWQPGRSLQSDWDALDIPIYSIGALLDGYRDTVPHLLEHVKVPVHAEIGPWNHAWPHDGAPGPDYEWRDTAVRWWWNWLDDAPGGAFHGKSLTVFMRGTVAPDNAFAETPGEYWCEPWPLRRECTVRLNADTDGTLSETPGDASMDTLDYVPSAGVAVGNWWGETTGDMRSADDHALVYDSSVLTDAMHILGIPEALLKVESTAPLADWIVRLEDVHPGDAGVSLVTGGLINGAQRISRTDPAPITPGETLTLRVPLRFTTYTFAPGHRIRLVVSNAQFPMIWPTPYAMTTSLYTGKGGSFIELPVVPHGRDAELPNPVSPNEEPGDAEYYGGEGLTPFMIVSDDPGGLTVVESHEASSMRVRDKVFEYRNTVHQSVNNTAPGEASFQGTGWERITFDAGRTLDMNVDILIVSDATHFNVRVTRGISENGVVLRERQWNEVIPRDFQ